MRARQLARCFEEGSHPIRPASLVSLFGGGQAISTCGSCGARIEGAPAKDGDEAAHIGNDGGLYHERCLPPVEPVSDRERQLIALKAAAPMRSAAGRVIERQDNTDALPLFLSANEPGLF